MNIYREKKNGVSDMQTNIRDKKYDYIKGLLIFSVVLGHVLVPVRSALFNDFKTDPLFMGIYSFHMPLFAFLSGYFASKSIQKKFKFCFIDNCIRLLVPIFSYLLVSFVFTLIFDRNLDSLYKVDDSFSVKKLFHFITGAWYLWCIFFLVEMGNCTFIISRKNLKLTFCILGLVAVILNVFYKWIPAKDLQIPRQLIFFLVGLIYRNYKKRIDRYAKYIFFFSVVGYVLFIRRYVLWQNYYYENFMFAFSVPFFFILFGYLYIKTYTSISSVICFLGQNTLGIYMLHFYFLKMIKPVCIDSLPVSYLIGIGVSMGITALCLALCKVFRMNKNLKLLLLGERTKQEPITYPKNIKLAVCALARDCAKRLENNIQALEKLEKFFDVDYFIVENNSRDNTRTILKNWASKNHRVHLHLFDLTENELKENRILRLANCRNIYLEMVKNSYKPYNLLMMVDIDVSRIDIESVLESIKTVPDDYVGLFSNGRWFYNFAGIRIPTNYNDLYALEFSVENNLSNVELLCKLNKEFKKNRFVKCTSAFGGIGIYKYEFIKNLSYEFVIDPLRDVPYCEHKLFNNALLSIGNLYIDKKMAVLYEPISLKTFLKYVLVPVNLRKKITRNGLK